jgi:hypothetical protein
MNQRKINRVAKAICFSAKVSSSDKCLICESKSPEDCLMGEQFECEAIAAIKEIQK